MSEGGRGVVESNGREGEKTKTREKKATYPPRAKCPVRPWDQTVHLRASVSSPPAPLSSFQRHHKAFPKAPPSQVPLVIAVRASPPAASLKPLSCC